MAFFNLPTTHKNGLKRCIGITPNRANNILENLRCLNFIISFKGIGNFIIFLISIEDIIGLIQSAWRITWHTI